MVFPAVMVLCTMLYSETRHAWERRRSFFLFPLFSSSCRCCCCLVEEPFELAGIVCNVLLLTDRDKFISCRCFEAGYSIYRMYRLGMHVRSNMAGHQLQAALGWEQAVANGNSWLGIEVGVRERDVLTKARWMDGER